MNSGAKRRGTVDRRGWVLEGRPEGPIRAGDRTAELRAFRVQAQGRGCSAWCPSLGDPPAPGALAACEGRGRRRPLAVPTGPFLRSRRGGERQLRPAGVAEE